MARRSKRSRIRIAKPLMLAAALALAALAAWFGYRYLAAQRAADRATIVDVSAERIDPANEGRRVKVSGQLSSPASAHDREFGVGTKAAMLFRKVEMLQWQEYCAGTDCSYDKVWSGVAIDSHRFRAATGHENPPLRLVSARFDAPNLHLGAFEVDPALIEAQLKAVDRPVRAAELPPNLAATFGEHDGVLYAGGDAAHPDVGTVRVSFREVPLGVASLTGAQRGKHLTH